MTGIRGSISSAGVRRVALGEFFKRYTGTGSSGS